MKDRWNQINEESFKGSVFVSWEWVYTWWEVYHNQGNRRLYILLCKNKVDDIVGIAPFQIINNPKKYFPCNRQLVMLATGETDGSSVFGEYMDLIIQAGYESAVISNLSQFLLERSHLWDGLKFHEQLADSNLSFLFSGDRHIRKTITESGFRTFIDLPQTYKEYLMGLRKKMRNNITRTFSRLESEQTYTLETVTAENNHNAIELLAALNRTRRGDLDKNSVFEKETFVMFHTRLLERLLPQNKVSLRILRFGDEAVAGLYSFIDGETIHAYQSGFETKNGHRYSLMTTLLTQEISKSIGNPALKRFNFMYSSDEATYKRRYSGTTEPMYNVSFDKLNMKYSLYAMIHGPIKSLLKKLLKVT